jgi:Mpv17 / PMP22 family.
MGGDLLCQFIEKKSLKKDPNTPYNLNRTLHMGLVGGLFSAPTLHIWYCRIAPALCRSITSNKAYYPFISLFFDQTIFAIMGTAGFFFFMDYLDHGNVTKSVANVKEKLWPTMITNWKVWPALNLINFTLIPVQFRVLYNNIFGVLWNSYLSFIQHN